MDIARLLLVLLCGVNVTLQALYFIHMLQLSGYVNRTYLGWCKSHEREVLPNARFLALVALGLMLVLFERPWAAWIAVGGVALSCLFSLPKKAKKPLRFTWRVRRLLGTFGLLAAAALVGIYFLPAHLCAVALLLLLLLTVLLVPLCNLLNAPVEKAIARHFVNDAKRLLREHPHLLVIGITGSYGKTSTKTFLHDLLSTTYNVLATPESYNTTLGVVRTIRERLKPSHEVFLCEMGARGVGEIQEICDIVHPTYGILTSIGEQHLETFLTVDNIIKTKFELADALPPDGRVFLNVDNSYIAGRPVTNTQVTTYGAAPDSTADYRASDITVDGGGCTFTVIAPDGTRGTFTTKLLGAHNVQNLTGCIALAHTLGISMEKLAYPVRLLRPAKHRLELLPNGFIDDAYNSNPAGFRSALDVLAGCEGERVLVTPGMVELGQRQDALNEELGAYAAGKCDYVVLVGQRQAPPLKRGLLNAGFPEACIFVCDTLQQGLDHLQSRPAAGKRTVLLENDLPDNYN